MNQIQAENSRMNVESESYCSIDGDEKATDSVTIMKNSNDEPMDQTSNVEVEVFDFTKTGAKPKLKLTQNTAPMFPTHKSSLSSSTSSSLSSLSIISQSSSIPSNTSSKKSGVIKNKKTSKHLDDSNYVSDNNVNIDYDNDDVLILNNSYSSEKSNSKNQLKLELETTAPCPLCFKSIETNLEEHFQQEHQEFECAFCGLPFDSDYILNQHMNTMHTDEFNKKANFLVEPTSNNADNLTCPLCMTVIKEGTAALEIHVDSHYSENKERKHDNFQMMSKTDFLESGNNKKLTNNSRTPSDSSLVANVDENFEIDQVMTMADMGDTYEQSSCSNDVMEMNIFDGKSDYEIALLLDKQEKSARSSSHLSQSNEYLTAQLLEKHQQQEVDHDLDYAIQLSYKQDPADVDKEHEWLKQKYGMANTKASSRAETTLNKALKNHKIDLVTYHNEKSDIENRVKSIYDDGTTCSKDIIEILEAIQINTKLITKRMLCSRCDHFASGFIDNSYGCGYRNTQVLFSSIREDNRLKDTIFNNNNFKIPSINKIQLLIENAWDKGFDLEGKTQLGGKLAGTAKWIGGSDVCAMFSSLRIKCELVDIQPPKNVLIGPILFKYVKNYFEEQSAIGHHIHPIYLQHDGHSRTIVGYESGKSENLLLFDPSTRKNKIEQFRSSQTKPMQTFRRNISVFNKYEAYQLVVIRDILKTDEQFEDAKVLRSTRITS